ncbi:uncharacterized protein BT62DRAFT_1000080 [Guyanagaster necrorhizus]|uniref:Homeobox domain-containing protein n=1 Tax=Guyanagaster necrorhizus TaxID=856835 RepID=A0A9P7W2U7_9AGAR|nr:uncharacterized protein BT62DRAFT_1000080 [Guyanagaster necrorhizus MCA 3950]KAG7452341.1 hypothetical protein BT62DRAFT_1000080 [Guyanagaster necrorhizus MCA 3950]
MGAGITDEHGFLAFLQRTSKVTKLFKQSIGPIELAPPVTLPKLDLELPIPDHVKAELDNPCTPIALRNALDSAISDLRAEYQCVFDKAYQRSSLAPVPQQAAMQRFVTLIQHRFTTQALPGLMRHHLKEALASTVSAFDENRPTPKFNNAYIPYLKAYFNYNAYPSPQDREVMAAKSMMTSRQIEVWFQNHRRVEKKAGRPCVKRKATDAGPSQSQIDKIEQEMGVFGVPKEERQEERERLRYIRQEKEKGFRTLSAPRYPRDPAPIDVLALASREKIPSAGPTRFRTGIVPTVYFPPPTWTRRPATQPLPHHAHCPNFAELTERFALILRIHSDIARVSEASVPPAATCATTTRLERGYHPALLNTPEKRRRRVPNRPRPYPSRTRSPSLHRQVSWSSGSSGSEESLPATPQNMTVELEPEPFDELFDEPVQEVVLLDIQGFVYADYPAPVIAVGGKKKSYY